MDVPPDHQFNEDLLVFANETKARFIDLVEKEIEELNRVKVSFGLKTRFSRQRDNGDTLYGALFQRR